MPLPELDWSEECKELSSDSDNNDDFEEKVENYSSIG